MTTGSGEAPSGRGGPRPGLIGGWCSVNPPHFMRVHVGVHRVRGIGIVHVRRRAGDGGGVWRGVGVCGRRGGGGGGHGTPRRDGITKKPSHCKKLRVGVGGGGRRPPRTWAGGGNEGNAFSSRAHARDSSGGVLSDDHPAYIPGSCWDPTDRWHTGCSRSEPYW